MSYFLYSLGNFCKGIEEKFYFATGNQT